LFLGTEKLSKTNITMTVGIEEADEVVRPSLNFADLVRTKSNKRLIANLSVESLTKRARER
jgi:hypothetical protein